MEAGIEVADSKNLFFTLDIGTRSVIGIVGTVVEEKLKVIAIEMEEHSSRAMIDGQIEDIEKVSKMVASIKEKLENRLGVKLNCVSVAAAGRALRTERAVYEMEFPETVKIDEEIISELETGAISKAEMNFSKNEPEYEDKKFYLVGYTAAQYYIDGYEISTLKEHHAKKIKVDIIATFLPSEVVESLYSTMRMAGLEISSLTLEPIAAINCVIPENIRLLNLALVDIGAGTTDIAVCRSGSVVGYTMTTTAGDEITEKLMKEYIIDFDTAERMKHEMTKKNEIVYTNILGLEETVDSSELMDKLEESGDELCREISEKIIEVNGSAPSAVFLAGGGSNLNGLCEKLAGFLEMDEKRVAVAGANFQLTTFSDEYNLNNPAYATPLGIAVSAGLNLINDSFRVILNGKVAKLFRSGSFDVRDVLMMNGYGYDDLIGRNGRNIIVTVNGKRKNIYGELAKPAFLTLNGENAKLSDTVNAGDVIDFKPAENGRSAQIKISDLIEEIGINGNQILVNGEEATLETLINDRDIIKVSFEKDFESPQIIDDELEIKDVAGTELEVQEFLRDELKDNKESVILDTKVSEEPIGKEINIRFNDTPLKLPPKDDGMSYYIYDLLEQSGIDLEEPEGLVQLRVNGKSVKYGERINDGDDVCIFCMPRSEVEGED